MGGKDHWVDDSLRPTPCKIGIFYGFEGVPLCLIDDRDRFPIDAGAYHGSFLFARADRLL
ncbi:MAG: hypothetical protein AUK55_11150 [Syntrophobacteraceae bacterium CG2_30_61_12]|nr:MAG: hypothetical protein AUK55_11150 [Syntrophobacteraceae bacterium CG2_30_61_12]